MQDQDKTLRVVPTDVPAAVEPKTATGTPTIEHRKAGRIGRLILAWAIGFIGLALGAAVFGRLALAVERGPRCLAGER